MRALLIANTLDCDSGFVGERLREQGYSFAENLRERPADWTPLDGNDLVVLMGSEWSVYWPDNAPFVTAETELVQDAHRRGVPVLGICYGAQMIAHALGGTVERAREPEVGWYDITSDIDAIAPGPWLQWHSDCFTPPPGAEELGRSSVGTQIIRLGHTFATQFHPEGNEAIVTRWARSESGETELKALGSSSEEFIETSRVNVIDSRPNAYQLVDWFLNHVANA